MSFCQCLDKLEDKLAKRVIDEEDKEVKVNEIDEDVDDHPTEEAYYDQLLDV